MTLAARYNEKAATLLPQHIHRLRVDPSLTEAAEIGDAVFAKCEYGGGMAQAILAMVKAEAA